ncbi:MAG: AAA-like domain-containing protein, partial [Blastocatellia bacterium]
RCFMTQVFISYRHISPDQDLAGFLEGYLKSRGFAVFIDTQLLVGDKWVEEIERQIRASSFFVVLLSADSIRSDMVRREVKLAYQLAKEPDNNFVILPIRVAYRGELPYDIGAYLDPIHYAFWEKDAAFEPICNQIFAAIERREALPYRRQPGAATADAIGALADATENRGAPLPAADPRLMFDKGTMKIGSPFYIRREADAQIENRIQLNGETIVVKGMRQMGKSSLLAAAMASARQRKQKIFYVDFQLVDHEHLQTLDILLDDLAWRLADELDTAIKPDEVRNNRLGAKASLTKFIEKAILADAESPILFFLDEADLIFNYGYRDHFFSLIRGWHNLRATNENWTRLSLIVAHSTEPHLWIQDINQSPFNVGFPIRLDDFDEAQVTELNERHGRKLETTDDVKELMKLLGGQPYLIRQALYALATDADLSLAKLMEIAPSESGLFGDHLRRYNWLLQESKELKDALRQILRDNRCDDERLFQRLRAAGLIRGETRHEAKIRCGLYAEYFKHHLG